MDWRAGANRQALIERAGLLRQIRAFFDQAGVLEVETPLATATSGTDPALQPMSCEFRGPGYSDGLKLFLQTSPEFAMKRLLAGGSGAIYQVCKAFRDGEVGRRHNPEFTILEWYRPGFDHLRLIDEVADLMRSCLDQPQLPVEVHSYAALFRQHLSLDIFDVSEDILRGCALDHHILGAESLELSLDGWLDLLMSHLLEPLLGRAGLSFVADYPASQASLARLNVTDPRTASRFELYYQGLELANGFHELTDATELSARFEAENCQRRSAGLDPMPVDFQLLSAMEYGLPDCAGVALGLDRLLMLKLGLDDIDQVLAFSLGRT